MTTGRASKFSQLFLERFDAVGVKALGISQPTVARHIDALEHALRLKLFDRDTRGFRATQDGVRLKVAAEAVEALVGVSVGEGENSLQANSKPKRITAPRTNFSANFAKILSDFSAVHLGAHFGFISTYDVLDLSAGEVDVAIRIARNVEDQLLICRKLT